MRSKLINLPLVAPAPQKNKKRGPRGFLPRPLLRAGETAFCTPPPFPQTIEAGCGQISSSGLFSKKVRILYNRHRQTKTCSITACFFNYSFSDKSVGCFFNVSTYIMIASLIFRILNDLVIKEIFTTTSPLSL